MADPQPDPFRVTPSVPTVLLLMLAGVSTLFGLATLSPATQGVGGLALACLLAILARIAQAGRQHADAMRARSAAATASPSKVNLD